MNNIKNKLGNKLSELADFWETHTAPMTQTTLGSTPDANDVVAGMDPTRVRFYLQVINRLPKFKQILREYNLGSNIRESWYSSIRDINSKGKYISGLPNYRQKRIKREINDKLKQNPLTEKFAYGQNNTGTFRFDPQTYNERKNIERLKEQAYTNQAQLQNVTGVNTLLQQNAKTTGETSAVLESVKNSAAETKTNMSKIKTSIEEISKIDKKEGGGQTNNFFTDKLSDIEDIKKQISANTEANAAYNTTQNRGFSDTTTVGDTFRKTTALNETKSREFDDLLRGKDNVIASIEEHPIYGPKEQKTTPVDRSIFCALTFIIRGISLYLMDWAYTTRMITTLTEGFFFYVAVYWLIFGLICLLVNTKIEADNSGFANPFKAIFYYLNTDVNSSARIWIHLFIQFMLFPIILFISAGSTNPDQDSYAQRKQIQYIINNLSLLMWFLTSIIAFRV